VLEINLKKEKGEVIEIKMDDKIKMKRKRKEDKMRDIKEFKRIVEK
jgi:hypothetical protein